MTMGKARRQIVSDFVVAGATVPGRGIAYTAGNARAFRRLLGFGAIVDDGAGRYHLDAGQLGAFRSAVRLRNAAIVATSGVAASAAAALTAFTFAE